MMFTLRHVVGSLVSLVTFASSVALANQVNYYYVVTNNPSAQAPYTNWSSAATSIQLAVNAAQGEWGGGTNCIVLVSNGIYTLASSLTISTSLTVRSVNGASSTILQAGASGFSLVTITNTPAANTVLDGLTIRGANYSGFGGGLSISAANCALLNCVVTGNAAARGGGLYITRAGIVSNSIFRANSASLYGGAVRDESAGSPSLYVNCVLDGNQAVNGGGGAFILAIARMENCTFSRNKSGGIDYGGGVLVWSGTDTQFRNSILYDNLGDGATKDNYAANAGTVTFINCCTVPLPASGPNNIDSNPFFVSVGSGYGTSFTSGNYRLKSDSPCVDAGTNQLWMIGARDLAGKPRIAFARVDLGAYEFMWDGTLFSVR